MVIRLNNAPVHGYEQDVGSKTTMRLFYPESAHFDPQAENNPNTLLVLVPFKPCGLPVDGGHPQRQEEGS